jgi:hypothetical protein
MKSLIFLMTAVSLGLTYTALADNYKDLAAQGYRWVTSTSPMPVPLSKTFNAWSLTVQMPQHSKWWRTFSASTSYREPSFR